MRLDRLPVRALAAGVPVAVAASARARLLGLAWLDPPSEPVALELSRCRSVHTFGMRFALDLIWLGARGQPVRLDRAVPPRRLRACARARGVVEVRAGQGERLAEALRFCWNVPCAHSGFSPRPDSPVMSVATEPASPLPSPSAPPPALPARSRRRPGLWALAALAALAWLVVGGLGAYRYVHGYWLYRGFPANVTPPGIPRGTVEKIAFRSPALRQRRDYYVYLPPYYRRQAAHGRRFPVLYLLHAPPGRVDGYFKAGAIDVRENVLLAMRATQPMLFVVPNGKTPRFHNDTEWANAEAGRFEDYVMNVVHDVDHRFATLHDRQHRGIAGLSEGGYGAINIALHRLRTFSVAQSWSGYFTQTRTASFDRASPAMLAANSPALYLPRIAGEVRRLGLRTYLYQGTKDPINPQHIRQFAQELHRAGAFVAYGFYPGGHDWGLWRKQVPRMLKLVSRWFGQPTHDYSLTAPVQSTGAPLPKAIRDRVFRRLRARCFVAHLPPGKHRPRLCRTIRGAYQR